MSNKKIAQSKNSILLDIDGMKCGSCVQAVEKIIKSYPKVNNASVNLVTKTAFIEIEEPNQSLTDLIQTLTSKGFPSKERDYQTVSKNIELETNENLNLWNKWRQLIIATSLLILSGMGHLVEGQQISVPIIGSLPFHAALATFSLLGPGRSILKAGINSAMIFTPTMDTLVSLGVLSAYIASIIALIWPRVGWPCFFNEPVMLLGFVLLGRFLEERARIKTGTALKELAKLQPETANLVLENNETREIRIGALRPGEKIQLLAGDRIPVDGLVIKGNSAIDISSLTGESLPLDASPGTKLPSGSLNLESTITLEVQKIGSETAIAKIISLVEEAQARKAPIQGLADKVAGIFCYGVTSLAFITFLFWWKIGTKIWPEVLEVSNSGFMQSHHLHDHLMNAAQTPIGLSFQLSIAVLVVACPCALGLATPTVITVASGEAAKRGWLFKGGDVIEMASKVSQIIFDKTGTLTIGRPLVVGSWENQDTTRKEMLRLAASIEQDSRHPLAQAIIQEANKKEIILEQVSSSMTFAGKGLSGKIQDLDGLIRVGTPEWIRSEGVEWNEIIEENFKLSKSKSQSIVAVAMEEKLLGFFLIDDQIRKDAFLSINKLRSRGFSLSLFSGDRDSAVISLGEKLGFSKKQIEWQMLPSDKLDKLNDLKNKGLVAMIGDGINDAPALAAADLGVAIGTGTQIAQDSADLVLLGENLEALPNSLQLSKQAMLKIRQNLAWAFGYNLIALPIAAGLLLPSFGLLLSPPLAALLMALSSISVVFNALSLKSK
ncbi:heavy metal translocating P-type ATPase [Prochlorococcus marinus]|uniref:Heavy metal translocating P-type ATPase n=1 Tax=Prochlorococcus marinus XMU1408 TaxID=2213228 RepID=A0A318R748_PROMR|nr:cation-translocating P-type ATPase [Prochlorococcus marinus]MBW3041192.1 heavy metal translocating P-type ATPase [Prochlorococcus marinus str. XMU1408]PYE03787.1 heavy metal translocating P-type ATPase [Prochlorococcus marinus XMU1408]